MRRLLLSLTFAVAACGQPVPKGNGAADSNAALPDMVTAEPTAVAIGELGASFDACSAAGTTSHVEAGDALPVRAAPFDNAAQTGSVAPGARFFVCSRSLDQKWFGIVYDEGGALAQRCGVSGPIAARRAYAGPCRSGWVASPFVKLTGGEAPAAPDSNGAAPAPVR
jgi:hypothetical protein